MAGCAMPLSYDATIHSREYIAMRERIRMKESLHFALKKKKRCVRENNGLRARLVGAGHMNPFLGT